MNPESESKILAVETSESQTEEEKLFTLNDIEGHEQLEKISRIKELVEILNNKDPRVVGLTVTGSTVQGYALPESDIDINIVFDSSGTSIESVLPKGQRLSDFFQNDVTDFSSRVGTSFELLGCKDLGLLDEGNLLEDPAAEIGILVYPFFGDEKKRGEIVLRVREILKHLDTIELERWINDFATGMSGDDLPEKKFRRSGIILTHADRTEYIEKRRALYKQKIKEIFVD